MSGLYEDTEQYDYSTNYSRHIDQSAKAARTQVAPDKIYYTVHSANDVGTKVRSRRVEAKDGRRGLVKQMNASHWSIHGDDGGHDQQQQQRLRQKNRAHRQQSVAKASFQYTKELYKAGRRAPSMTAKQSHAKSVIYPVDKESDGDKKQRYVSTLHQQYVRKQAQRPQPHITVAEGNDIGSKAKKRVLGPAQLYKPQWKNDSGANGNDRSHLQTHAQREYATMKAKQQQSPNRVKKQMQAPPAGQKNQWKAERDIITGRRRKMPSTNPYQKKKRTNPQQQQQQQQQQRASSKKNNKSGQGHSSYNIITNGSQGSQAQRQAQARRQQQQLRAAKQAERQRKQQAHAYTERSSGSRPKYGRRSYFNQHRRQQSTGYTPSAASPAAHTSRHTPRPYKGAGSVGYNIITGN